jgi:aarF domain-containing kinase
VLSRQYDPEVLESFFSNRQLLVWERLANITVRFALLYVRGFLHGGQAAALNPPSDVLCDLLATLGPTFVKLGQTLSTREDIVGKDLARTLSDLQMAAPPFEDSIAHSVIKSELKSELEILYDVFTDTHVAAASLGQVYRAKLRRSSNGTEGDGTLFDVAVKVQRPDLLGSIALDVYVLRLALGLLRKAAKINSDIRSIADEVGRGLFAELDYRVEASQVHCKPVLKC